MARPRWKRKTSSARSSVEDILAELRRYKPLFSYEATEAKRDVLGDEFDEKLFAAIAERKPVKARVITMTQRFKPLLKAAAMVAILLTLGNAMQVPFSKNNEDPISNYDGYYKPGSSTTAPTSPSVTVQWLTRCSRA